MDRLSLLSDVFSSMSDMKKVFFNIVNASVSQKSVLLSLLNKGLPTK